MDAIEKLPPLRKRATALAFIEKTHRRLPKIQGAMWAIAAWRGGDIVGVAVVGWPAPAWTSQDCDTLAILRVAVQEGPAGRFACSKLYGACWRAARGMGAESMVTYTHLDEPGTSLIAAGWILDGETDGGEWSREGRQRQLAIDPDPKRRWWAPGSKRISREE